ncbi:MAG TPA: hypothetical protein VJ400_07535 [Thermoplasmata archaeon]|nr:hypothetical protein [Thermoplasmata archaeon]
MYAVFDVKPEAKANGDAVLQDDVVSRQSIAVREGRALGFPDHGLLYLIEGAESVLARAEELFRGFGSKLAPEPARAVYEAIKSQEDDVASGIGMIFG